MPIYNCADCPHRSPWEEGDHGLLYADCLFKMTVPTCVETRRQKLIKLPREVDGIGMLSQWGTIGYINRCRAHPNFTEE